MNRVTLKDYLDDPKFARKVQVLEDEAPEFVLGIYSAIKAAIRQNCSIIEVLDEEIRWKKQIGIPSSGRLPFPIDELLIPSTMRHYFDLVMSRDTMISSNLQLIHRTNDRDIYWIL